MKMIRNTLTLLAFSLSLSFVSQAQVIQPAKITTENSQQSVAIGTEVELIFKASIDKNWYIYAVGFDADCGPIPLNITLEKNSTFELVGGIRAINDKAKHDKIFDCDVRIFENAGEFRQKIKVLSKEVILKGSYEGQVCSELEGKCVLFDGEFAFDNIDVTSKAKDDEQKIKTERPREKHTTSETKSEIDEPPVPILKNIDSTTNSSNDTLQNKKDTHNISVINKGPVLNGALINDATQQESLIGFFFLSFLAGLAALLTPCVFPMIPMTVSYFTAPGKAKSSALFYGLSIIAIYTLIGAALAPLMGPETANHLSTEWLPNLIFFTVFIVFGLSFLGLFDITLPGTFVTRVDRQAEKGGLLGVFFMAFTLVLVSFSCTGPLVGSILVSSAGGEVLKPIIGMFGFALAFAIPFTLFAIFPGWLSSLPKSGGWLNTVKVVLGFIEIALAFKFLSIADQAFHWRLLDREINIAIWIVLSMLIGVYLMKGFRLPGDTGKDAEEKRVNVFRVLLAIIAFTFVVYLVPGMWGAPLKALAGYLPPMSTHDFNLISANRNSKGNEICDEPKYATFLHLPHNINGYFDYDQALACARQQNKPLFIDFTGHGCTNCREMEAVVWSDPQVLERLKNDYIVAALYVDDKTELPSNQWYTSRYDGKVKKTIGKQNADLQITNLNNNAQPFYVLVGKDESVLVTPFGYDKSVDRFIKFLDEGKKNYKALYPE